MIVSQNTGEVKVYNLDMLLHKYIQTYTIVKHSNTKANYNPYRNISEDFIKCMNNMKLNKLVLNEDNDIEQ